MSSDIGTAFVWRDLCFIAIKDDPLRLIFRSSRLFSLVSGMEFTKVALFLPRTGKKDAGSTKEIMRHTFKLGFGNRSIPEQLSLCELTVMNIGKLPVEKRGQTDLDKLTTAVAEAVESHQRVEALRAQLKAEVSRRKTLLAIARNQARTASGWAAMAANYHPIGMLEAGLTLSAQKTVPVGKPAAPEQFHAEPTSHEGEIRLRCQRPLRRCVFEIQIKTEVPESEWKTYEIAGRQTCLVKGLTSGEKYWFRIRAHNAHGEGPWSNPVSARAK